MFEYKAKVLNVVDGDTIDVELDLGFDTYRNERIRLAHINTPEIRTKDVEEKKIGMLAKTRVLGLILGKTVILQTIKDKTEKYGRYLGIVILEDGKVLNDLLVTEGLAVNYLIGKK